jgi:hypothetical protein
MFAPEGYISLEEIAEILDELAQEWRLSTPHDDDPKPGGYFDNDTFSFIDDEWQRSGAYSGWLMQCFLNRHETNLYVCTPPGRPLKVARSLVRRIRMYDGPFLDQKTNWASLIDHLKNPFWCISTDGHMIDVNYAGSVTGVSEPDLFLSKLDQYPVCWPLPKSSSKIDWLSVCGVDAEASKARADLSPMAVCKGILSVWRNDTALRKSEIKELVAPTLSARQFQLGWTLAAQENPTIAAPGRKKR